MGGIGKISRPVVVPLEMVKFGNFQRWKFYSRRSPWSCQWKKAFQLIMGYRSQTFLAHGGNWQNIEARGGPFGNGQIWEFSKMEILFQEKPLELPMEKSFPINYGLSIPDIFSPWGELAKYRGPWWSLWKWSNLGIFKDGNFIPGEAPGVANGKKLSN